ncbi:coenzyme F420-0:L-glutamate ligase [Aquipuribacter sp. MA13-6]|uniref:coenzyme F420-0:L-glutamate ligase n=1 Tax=unclassified Aquipuribacter TaxID=2635084 RepID=UPI003EEAA2FB
MTSAPVDGLAVLPLRGVGEVRTGDDLAGLLLAACERAGHAPGDEDVLVVSSKVLAKSLGLWRADRDSAVLAESRGVVAERRTPNGVTRIVRAAAGPVMAAAGVDASNTGPEAHGRVLVLPHDPDAQATRLRDALGALTGSRPAVLLTDTSGRPWRVGQTDFALGCAGLRPTDDLRGGVDADGVPLQVTVRAVADELAAAAELVKGKADGVPAALVRGCGHLVTREDGPGAAGLVRFDTADWFATGTVESVRAALGCPPGTPDVEPAPAVPDGDRAAVLRRAVEVVRHGCVGDVDLAAVRVRLADPTVTTDGAVGAGADGAGALVEVVGPVVAAARVAERVAVYARAERLATTVGPAPTTATGGPPDRDVVTLHVHPT